MAPAPSYSGPHALGFSRYASPSPARVAPVPSLAVATSPTPAAAGSVIATKQQIAATNNHADLGTASSSPSAELAVARGNALKVEVDEHTAKFSRNVSNAMAITHRLLHLIHESMQKENVKDVHILDELLAELDQLFAAIHDNKAAMPAFLEKQRNNMSLYHASMMNEIMRETQEELNIQHKKVNIQHNLILEHQEAFQEYKAQTAAKLAQAEKTGILEELKELQERCSRLTLEKGNFRTELDKYKQMLESERSVKKDTKEVEALQKELGTVKAKEQQLLADSDTYQKTAVELQEQMDAMAEKYKQENRMLTEKYKNQAAEHAGAFTRLTELTKKFDALTAKVEGLEAENANLKQNEAAIADIKNHNAELLKAKANMLQQDGALRLELSAAKDDRKRAEAEIKSLKEHLDEHAGKMKDLELRNSNLLSDRADMERVLKELQVLKSEKLKLTTTLEGMRANAAVPLMSDEEKSALMETISGLERQKTDLETSRQECLDLAKRSYQEYKQMKPTFDQAEQYRKDALTKDGVIKSLKLELSAAKTSASNGGGPSADAVYWKDKYESLLANIDG